MPGFLTASGNGSFTVSGTSNGFTIIGSSSSNSQNYGTILGASFNYHPNGFTIWFGNSSLNTTFTESWQNNLDKFLIFSDPSGNEIFALQRKDGKGWQSPENTFTIHDSDYSYISIGYGLGGNYSSHGTIQDWGIYFKVNNVWSSIQTLYSDPNGNDIGNRSSRAIWFAFYEKVLGKTKHADFTSVSARRTASEANDHIVSGGVFQLPPFGDSSSKTTNHTAFIDTDDKYYLYGSNYDVTINESGVFNNGHHVSIIPINGYTISDVRDAL